MPQLCVADVTVWGDFAAAAATDQLSDAFDYVGILETVSHVAHCREYNLLETLAFKIARAVLESSPAQKVGVKVRKKPAVFSGRLDHVVIEVEQQ